MDNTGSFAKLPVEMVCYIFKFLKYEDRKAASSVCWLWYDASIHPMFVKNEVICLKNTSNHTIPDVLKLYSKSLRPFFAFKIYNFGVIHNRDEDDASSSIIKYDYAWVYTVWPLLAARVIFLEIFLEKHIHGGILPAILNVTQQLKVLKIHNLMHISEEELSKVNRLQSLEKLMLDNLQTRHIDKKKLIGIIPKTLRELCLKSMLGSMFIIKYFTNVLKFCSSHLESLELHYVDVTPKMMQSITSLGLKLKKFYLLMPDSFKYGHKQYKHQQEIILFLLKAQWPLNNMNIRANCLTLTV